MMERIRIRSGFRRSPHYPVKLLVALTLASIVVIARLGAKPTHFGIVTGDAIAVDHMTSPLALVPSRDSFLLTEIALTKQSPIWQVLVAESVDGAYAAYETYPESPPLAKYGDFRRRSHAALARAALDTAATAEYMAERAAGLGRTSAVRIPTVLEAPDSPTRNGLRTGDGILRVAGRILQQCHDGFLAVPDGHAVMIEARRSGSRVGIMLRTDDNPVIQCSNLLARPHVPLRLPKLAAIDDDAGLALALKLYESLRPNVGTRRIIAAAGNLLPDGRIGHAGFLRARVRAAERAGATIFFLPRADYADVAGAHKIKILPVSTFGEAIAALGHAS
jgi:PDZ domain-containing secreted protein